MVEVQERGVHTGGNRDSTGMVESGAIVSSFAAKIIGVPGMWQKEE